MKGKWIFETKLGKSEINSLPRLGHSNARQISTRNSSIKDSAARKARKLVELIVRCSCPPSLCSRLSSQLFSPRGCFLCSFIFSSHFCWTLLLTSSLPFLLLEQATRNALALVVFSSSYAFQPTTWKFTQKWTHPSVRENVWDSRILELIPLHSR